MVLGIALITMNEEIGHEMAMRSFEHLLHFATCGWRTLCYGQERISESDFKRWDKEHTALTEKLEKLQFRMKSILLLHLLCCIIAA